MKEKMALFDYLLEQGCIVFSQKGFITKWGELYPFETDIRPAFLTQVGAKKTARLIYSLIRHSIKSFDIIIGVPETGSLIAFFLNACHAKVQKKNLPVNMLRSSPKPYQGTTTYTVQPLSNKSRVVLVEDDVVTGKTLCKYVKILHKLGMKHVQVVSIIDRQHKDERGLTVKQHIERDFGYVYHALVTMDDIKTAIPIEEYVG